MKSMTANAVVSKARTRILCIKDSALSSVQGITLTGSGT
jgi:hypothetical protein